MQLSVALVTCERPESLRRCLASLRSQSAQPDEVLVSDDSNDHVASENRAICTEFGARYQRGPRRGLYANRNAAALACRGTHIRTVDDDHAFAPGHFDLCFQAVQEHPAAVLTTGQRSYLDGAYFDEHPYASQLHPAGVGTSVHDPDNNWAIADGSTIYPASIFRSGFRMLELGTSYGASYLEFGALLYHRGIHSRCIPAAMVEHYAETCSPNRDEAESNLYASLCFNLRFRPNRARGCRYLLSYLVRRPNLVRALPRILRVLRTRWDHQRY